MEAQNCKQTINYLSLGSKRCDRQLVFEEMATASLLIRGLELEAVVSLDLLTYMMGGNMHRLIKMSL